MESVQYVRAENLPMALELLQEGNTKILSGGTDLLLKFKHGVMGKRRLLDISQLQELRSIEFTGDAYHIGAAVKIRDLIRSGPLNRDLPLLVSAAKKVGSMEIKNMGSIGGNICSIRANCGICFAPGCGPLSGGGRTPCQSAAYSDLLLPLCVYDALLVISSAGQERIIPVREFQQESGAPNLRSDELVREVVIPCPAVEYRYGCAELRYPHSMGRPILSVIAAVNDRETAIALGGSLKHIYMFKASGMGSGWEKQLGTVEYRDCLTFSSDYRRRVLPELVDEAVRHAKEEC